MIMEQAAEHCSQTDVLVIDNDPNESARDIVLSFSAANLRYVAEPVAGISAARNRALVESENVDILIFIDDDERPQPGWLNALIGTYEQTRAAAVAGAVISEFVGELDPWVRAGQFFVRRRLRTGTPITLAATNNLLLDLRQIRSMGVTFNEEFGQSGGSDTLFSRQLTLSGGVMVWCDDAVVIDMVPSDRMTRSWVLRRAFRAGNTWARTSIYLASTRAEKLVARLKLLGEAAPRTSAGLVRILWGFGSLSPRHQARGARTLARGAGMAAGSLGFTFQEYKRPQAGQRKRCTITPGGPNGKGAEVSK